MGSIDACFKAKPRPQPFTVSTVYCWFGCKVQPNAPVRLQRILGPNIARVHATTASEGDRNFSNELRTKRKKRTNSLAR